MAKNRSKNTSKRFSLKTFTLVAGKVQRGEFPLCIDGISKQRLNYHLKRFEDLGLIEKTTRGLWQEYRLTPTSKRFVMGDDGSHILRLEAVEYTFPVISWGSYPMEKQSSLTPSFPVEPVDDFRTPYKVARFGDITAKFFAKSIVIYPPVFYCDNEAEGHGKIMQRVLDVLYRELINRFGIKLGPWRLNKRPEAAIINNPFTESLAVICAKKGVRMAVGDFWLDNSPKGRRQDLETSTPGKAQQFIDSVMVIPTLFEQLNPTLSALASQINLHLSVMQEIQAGLSKQTAIFEQIKDIISHLRGD